MANEYYMHSSGQPVQLSRGASGAIRAEFDAIQAAFDKVETNLGAASSAADFKLIYQGALSTDPTQRYNGTQLQNGDLYFNTVAAVFKSFYNGAWFALPTSSSVMLKDGGTFLGPIGGTSAVFTSSITAAGFIGSGAGLTGLTSGQITNALAYVPLNKAGDTMTGVLNGTVVVLTGTVTASDFIMVSDEKNKMKWEKLPDDVLDKFAAMKKIGVYTEKKSKNRRVGAGAQSMAEIHELLSGTDDDGNLGINYGADALVLLHMAMQRIKALEKRLAKVEKK
jgi:hypothetical protein